MRVKVLVDNTAGVFCEAAHGFSLWIEADRKILFDAGPSDLFLRNAKKLNIDLDEADAIVLSHGHWDHGNGLEHLSGKSLITHPHSFIKRFREKDFSHIGLPFSREQAMQRYDLVESIGPHWLSDNMVFLGQIPRRFDFEEGPSFFVKEDGSPDPVEDDSALVVKHSKGLVVITGCAHSGVCNTVAYAREVCKEERVHAVLGGFHLKKRNPRTMKTVEYLKNLGVDRVLPTHCTGIEPLMEFYREFGGKPLHAGACLLF
ncbi:MAG: MBL fold metallo-hydrolase [Marinifilaceae bacterium]